MDTHEATLEASSAVAVAVEGEPEGENDVPCHKVEPQPSLLETVVMPLVSRFFALGRRREVSASAVRETVRNEQKQAKNQPLNGAQSDVNAVHLGASAVHCSAIPLEDPQSLDSRISEVKFESPHPSASAGSTASDDAFGEQGSRGEVTPDAVSSGATPVNTSRSETSAAGPYPDGSADLAIGLEPQPDPKTTRWPWTLLVGLKLIIISEIFLFIDVALRGGLVVGHNATVQDIPWPQGVFAEVARVFSANMTPICWIGYLLIFDGLLVLLARRQRNPAIASLRARPNRFIVAWLASVPTWCFFDWINFAYIDAWRYHGLPDDGLTRIGGYFIAFAAITPGMLLAAQALLAMGWRRLTIRDAKVNGWFPWAVVMCTHAILAGVILLLMAGDEGPPAALSIRSTMAMLLWPGLAIAVITRSLSATCFALGIGWTAWSILVQDPLSCMALWVGVIFLLDPLCYWMRGPSMIGDWKAGRWGRFLALMAGGALCGLLWEFWNYWALAKWTYHLPFLGATESFRYFEMPWLGFLGFLPFAIECWVAVNFAAALLDRLGLRSAEPLAEDHAI
ncbi:MAG: hypothetical protein WD768_10480 [Phycisphaeraceae bacterium]